MADEDYDLAARGSVASATQLRDEVARTGVPLDRATHLANQGLLHLVPAKADPIVEAYRPVAPILAVFGHTPESYGSLVRRLGCELEKVFAPRR